MKIGVRIPWNVTAICEKFRITCLMGRHHMKGGSECPLTDQWYRLEQFSAAFPSRYASFCRTSEIDAASNELGSTLILLSGFFEAIGIPGLLDAIVLDAVEELVGTWEDMFIAAGRDLDTTPSCILTSLITSFLFNFRHLPCRDFLQFSHSFSTATFASGIFYAWGIGVHLCTRLLWVIEFIPFAVMWSWWGLCPAPSSLGLVLSSASTTQAYFVLRFPILRWVVPRQFIGILQGIAAGIGTSNFLRAAFIVSLNSSSFGSLKNIPLN